MRRSRYCLAALFVAILLIISSSAVTGCRRKAAENPKPTASVTPTSTPASPATTSVEPSPTTTTGVEPATSTTPPAEKAGRFFTYIDSIKQTPSGVALVLDYAQFLTGKAAAQAAKAEGQESPPPNDYYIVNSNTKLRTIPVKAGLKITMITTAEGPQMDGYAVSLDSWIDMVEAGPEAYPPAKTLPYWVTVKDGKVSRVEEQYLP